MTRALTSTEFAARSGKGDGTGRPIVVVDTMYSDVWVGCFSGSHARMPFYSYSTIKELMEENRKTDRNLRHSKKRSSRGHRKSNTTFFTNSRRQDIVPPHIQCTRDAVTDVHNDSDSKYRAVICTGRHPRGSCRLCAQYIL